MSELIIYTDGASRGNPGPGGYGAILQYKGKEKELSAGYRRTTNNRMELMAVIAALKALTQYPKGGSEIVPQQMSKEVKRTGICGKSMRDWHQPTTLNSSGFADMPITHITTAVMNWRLWLQTEKIY